MSMAIFNGYVSLPEGHSHASKIHVSPQNGTIQRKVSSHPSFGSDKRWNSAAKHGTCPADVFPHAGIILWFGDGFQVDLAIPGKLISSPTTKDTTIDAVAWSHKNWFNYKENSATEKWPANLGPIEETFKRNEPYPRDSRLLSNHWCKHSQLHGRKGSYLGPDVETSGCSRQHIVCVHL